MSRAKKLHILQAIFRKEALETLDEQQRKVYNMWMIKGEEEEDDQVLCDAATTHAMLQLGHATASSIATRNRSLLNSVKDAAANSLLGSQLGAQTLKKCDILGLFCIVLQRHFWT
ncbi:hypothetical protein H5410_026860 [Solanum commersonii]|uniref:Uncharacterized protein n=1 Tax=Solanum commersonii TaxID=4109 RepID=A0A9J5Z040_SOLCO|nr:hypothetical protein H5410_026860 [Solanum commersonii]